MKISSQQNEKIWGKRLFYFHCPVCEKPYNIEYDQAATTAPEKTGDDNTVEITKGHCVFCETKILVAYDPEMQQVIAFDVAEEKHWRAQSAEFEKAWKKLQKLKKIKKSKLSDEKLKKRKKLQKTCEKLEKSINEHDNEYVKNCLMQVINREAQESVPFPLSSKENAADTESAQ